MKREQFIIMPSMIDIFMTDISMATINKVNFIVILLRANLTCLVCFVVVHFSPNLSVKEKKSCYVYVMYLKNSIIKSKEYEVRKMVYSLN